MTLRKCPSNQLICGFDQYDGARPPKSDCSKCWELYNDRWDLPEGNRLSKSKAKKVARLSRRLPDMDLAWNDRPSNIMLALEGLAEQHRWVPRSIGIDCSLTNTGVSVIAKSVDTGELVTFVGSFGFSLGQKAAQAHVIHRIHSIANFVCDFYVEALGCHKTCPVFIEDHAFGKSTNRATMVHELHGAIKYEMYRRLGVVLMPVGIKTARSKVFCHGSPEGGKSGILKLMLDRFPWASKLNDDEVDAWVVAAHHLVGA